MARKVRRKSWLNKKTHNPKLKKTLKSKGSRLVHGYETARRKTKKRK